MWKFYQLFYRSTNGFHIWWDFPYQSKNHGLYPAPRICSRSHRSAHMRSICIELWANIIKLGNIIQIILLILYEENIAWTNVINPITNGDTWKIQKCMSATASWQIVRKIQKWMSSTASWQIVWWKPHFCYELILEHTMNSGNLLATHTLITSTLYLYLLPHLTAEAQQLNFHVWALSESDGHFQIYLRSRRFCILQSPLKKTLRNEP